MQEEIRKCDVLVIGGGIAGLMAAIKARELGASVIVAEKSNTLRSGAAGAGNDHFQCYIPEVHGDFDSFWKQLFYGQLATRFAQLDIDYLRYWFQNSYDVVKLWDSWGIPMKYEGKYEFAGHGFPGKQLNHLKYSGKDQKPVLTKEAKSRGVEIVNRVMMFDLLTHSDGHIVGAIGVSTREDKIFIFEAKSVVLTTGGTSRIYPPVAVGADNNRGMPITCSGDGRMMAYRAGAALKDLEMVYRHAGPKYFARMGQATWVGVLRDRLGNPVGRWLKNPDRRYHDMTIEVKHEIFEDYRKSGRGPIYMDMNGISKEDLEYMVHWMSNEGNEGLINAIKGEGLDMGKSAIEFQTFEMNVDGGVMANLKGETAVQGLFAAGDEVWVTMSHAAVFGWSAGEHAAQYSEKVKATEIETVRAEIDTRKAFLQEIAGREDGIKWQEAIAALQQAMFDYCGDIRCELSLDAGLDVLKRLKAKARSSLMSNNPHELVHCLQVLNLMDLGELTMINARERTETRGLHVRSDYLLTDPLLSDKVHIIKQVNDKPVTEWVQVKR